MRLVILALGVGTALVTGCQNLPPPEVIPPAEPPAAPIRLTQPLDGVVGRVLTVNMRLRFVVLDYSLNTLPRIGDRLELWRDGNRVGLLKVTGPIRNATAVADIVEGEPQPGDQTRPTRSE
jgi:hypothetical protein